jgi:hypothetical protein
MEKDAGISSQPTWYCFLMKFEPNDEAINKPHANAQKILIKIYARAHQPHTFKTTGQPTSM